MGPGSVKQEVVSAEIKRLVRIERIFMPYASRQRAATRESQNKADGEPVRFAHYTSAQSALSILRTKRVWMRNTTCMSDYREVLHGFEMYQRYFNDIRTREFAAALDVCAPGVAIEAINNFNGWWKTNLNLNIFVASLSEHDDSEDVHGRLSMWRAFGGSATRVALVIKIPSYSDAAQALGILFSPVAYLTEEQAHATIQEVITNVAREPEFLRTFER